MVGANRDDLGGSEYIKTIHNLITGDAPYLDLDEEKRVGQFVLAAITAGLVNSAHDVSDGGLAVCLAECCITNPDRVWGCTIALDSDIRPDALWFGESQSRVVLSLPSDNLMQFGKLANKHGVPITTLGRVRSGPFEFAEYGSIDPAKLHELYYGCLPNLMSRRG
jgi:phosphoribosylformylglycinamidine (FGAM) synthase-like enzyme